METIKIDNIQFYPTLKNIKKLPKRDGNPNDGLVIKKIKNWIQTKQATKLKQI